MSAQKPTLSTGFRFNGVNLGTANIEDRNLTLVRGNEHDATAGGQMSGLQLGTLNVNEQNLTT